MAKAFHFSNSKTSKNSLNQLCINSLIILLPTAFLNTWTPLIW